MDDIESKPNKLGYIRVHENDRMGNYEVHKKDIKTNVNNKVLNTVLLARTAKTPRDLLDCLSGGKTVEDLKNNNEITKEQEKEVDIEGR